MDGIEFAVRRTHPFVQDLFFDDKFLVVCECNDNNLRQKWTIDPHHCNLH